MTRKERQGLTDRQIFIRKRLKKLKHFCQTYWDLVGFDHAAWESDRRNLSQYSLASIASRALLDEFFHPVHLEVSTNFFSELRKLRQLAWEYSHTRKLGIIQPQTAVPYTFERTWTIFVRFMDDALDAVEMKDPEARRIYEGLWREWRMYVIKVQQAAVNKERARQKKKQKAQNGTQTTHPN